MKNKLKNRGETTARRVLRTLFLASLFLAFGLFLDWLIINLILGCCEGGVCWPDVYPQCRNETYKEFYGENYGNE